MEREKAEERRAGRGEEATLMGIINVRKKVLKHTNKSKLNPNAFITDILISFSFKKKEFKQLATYKTQT